MGWKTLAQSGLKNYESVGLKVIYRYIIHVAGIALVKKKNAFQHSN